MESYFNEKTSYLVGILWSKYVPKSTGCLAILESFDLITRTTRLLQQSYHFFDFGFFLYFGRVNEQIDGVRDVDMQICRAFFGRVRWTISYIELGTCFIIL